MNFAEIKDFALETFNAGKEATGERARAVGGPAPRDEAPHHGPPRPARAAHDEATIGSTVGSRTRTTIGRLALLAGLVGLFRGKRR